MNTTRFFLELTGAILGFQAIIWVLIFRRIRGQSRRLEEEARRMGEAFVLGPERADYQGWVKKYGYARTMGTLALTDRRLVFVRPLGRDISIPLSEILAVSDTATLGKLRHTSRSYLALTLRDGTEVVFWARDHVPWLEALRARLPSSP